MAINSYDVGDVVRVQGVFKNAAGTTVDPTAITFKFQVPDGTITTYIYGTDAEVVRSATGTYYCDITTTDEGRYSCRWAGTGNNAAAGERYFLVSESVFN